MEEYKKQIAGFERLSKREILDCRIKALKEMFHYWGYQINSYELLILCEAITFGYGGLNYHHKQIYDVPYMISTKMDVHRTVFDSLGIKYKTEVIDGTEQGLLRIKALIKKDFPVLVELDGSIFMKNRKKSELDLHYISYVLVVGFDDEKQEVSIVLTRSSETDKCITLSYEEFQQARISKCFPYPSIGRCFYLTEAILCTEEQTKEKIFQSLERISNVMLSGQKGNRIIQNNIEISNLEWGLIGMKHLAERYIKQAILCMLRKKSKVMFQLEFLIIRNNFQYGTLTGYRSEFYTALMQMGEKYENPYLEKAGMYIDKSNKGWKRLLYEIGMMAKNRNKINGLRLMKLVMLTFRIRYLEIKAFRLMRDICTRRK